MMMRPIGKVSLVVAASVILGGCTVVGDQIKSAGNFIGYHIGLVSKESYSPKDQEKQSKTVISSEQEYYIGRAVAARIMQRFERVNNEALQHYLQLIGATLVVNGETGAPFGGYHFMVVKSDQINAIAAPGGFIFVTSGFLKRLSSEDQLASILSHEIAHVSQRHGVKMLQQSAQLDSLSSPGLLTGGINCTEALLQATALFSQLVDSLVDTLLESGYSQDLEFEADAVGLSILLKSGYQAQSATEALKALEQGTAATGGGWFSTHPSAHDRLLRLATANSGGPTSSDPASIAVRLARFKKALASL